MFYDNIIKDSIIEVYLIKISFGAMIKIKIVAAQCKRHLLIFIISACLICVCMHYSVFSNRKLRQNVITAFYKYIINSRRYFLVRNSIAE